MCKAPINIKKSHSINEIGKEIKRIEANEPDTRNEHPKLITFDIIPLTTIYNLLEMEEIK